MRNDIPILMVEDDSVDIITLRRAFKKHKVTNPLYVVSNGEEALAFLRHEGPYKNPSESPRPGLILLDLSLPVMNGFEFLKVVKADADLRGIPVVVLTTSKEEEDRLASFELGVSGYIVKPVDFDKFTEAAGLINMYRTLSEKGHGGEK
jgi:CheY-like chemotaxis protein